MLGRLLLVLIALGGLVYVVVAARADVAPTPAARTPAPPSGQSVALQVEGVVDALAQAKQRGQPTPIALSFSDRDLTEAAARYFPQTYAGITFSDPVVTLRPGQIVLTGRATLGLIRSTFAVVGGVNVANARPVVRVDAASVGGVAVPDAARASIERDLQAAVASLLPPNLQLTSIVIASGSLAVKGVANP